MKTGVKYLNRIM